MSLADLSSPTVFDQQDLRVLREAYQRARHGLETAGIADADAASDLAKLLFGSGGDLIRSGGRLKDADAAERLASSASRAMVEIHAMPWCA